MAFLYLDGKTKKLFSSFTLFLRYTVSAYKKSSFQKQLKGNGSFSVSTTGAFVEPQLKANLTLTSKQ